MCSEQGLDVPFFPSLPSPMFFWPLVIQRNCYRAGCLDLGDLQSSLPTSAILWFHDIHDIYISLSARKNCLLWLKIICYFIFWSYIWNLEARKKPRSFYLYSIYHNSEGKIWTTSLLVSLRETLYCNFKK